MNCCWMLRSFFRQVENDLQFPARGIFFLNHGIINIIQWGKIRRWIQHIRASVMKKTPIQDLVSTTTFSWYHFEKRERCEIYFCSATKNFQIFKKKNWLFFWRNVDARVDSMKSQRYNTFFHRINSRMNGWAREVAFQWESSACFYF